MVIHNDTLLLRILSSLFIAVVIELLYSLYYDDQDDKYEENNMSDAADTRLLNQNGSRVIMSPPVHLGSLHRDRHMEDFLFGSRFIPKHCRRPRVDYRQRQYSNLIAEKTDDTAPLVPKTARQKSDEKRLSLLPKLPNCEADGSVAKKMQRMFPDESIVDIVRFLVARKGNIEQASAMMRSAVDWHSSMFPSKKLEIVAALKTGCFFSHGVALDGTPILFFRGAFYDSKVATPLQYVLAAAYVIDYAMAQCDQISVTVLVHACGIKGAPNESADFNFIKTFVQILSDNYPERLKRLVIYPFPWFGRALWGAIKMFVDKRSQDKVVLLPGEDIGCPPDLAKFVDPFQIPTCCGGLNTEAIYDITRTILDPDGGEDEADKGGGRAEGGGDRGGGGRGEGRDEIDDDDERELQELRNLHSSDISRINEENKDEHVSTAQQIVHNKGNKNGNNIEKEKENRNVIKTEVCSVRETLERDEGRDIMRRIMSKS